MHNYIWCPYYLPSFMKFCSVVSEGMRWQTVWRTDGQDKHNMSPHQSGGRHNNSSSHIKVSKLKGMSWIQLFKYIKFIHILGFVGSIVKGETICGGSTEPTLPKSASLSIIVLLMKFTKRLQLLAFLSTLAGENFVSYCTPLKVHIKGLIYLLMLTPFSSQFIISLNLSGESLKINFHSSKFLFNSPDTNAWSFLKDKLAIFG
jgi:hypothetical protein